MSSLASTTAKPALKLPLWLVSSVVWGLIVALAVVHQAGLGNSAAVGTFAVIFTSIVVEALPFILIGAIVSGAIAAFVPDRSFARLARLPRALQVPGAAIAGVAFPVCECGSVPVARRLLARGLDPAAGVAFMLAAPIVNPIVLGATWIAYSGRGDALEMTAGRAGLGLLSAVAVGLLAADRLGERLLRGESGAQDIDACRVGDDHDHSGQPRARVFFDHVTNDFMFMGRFLVLGAAISGVIQTVLPQQLLSGIGGTPVLAILTMIALAFALSLCSEADAFVAVSFSGFPLSAQLAFLVMGPALDAKLAVLYAATFDRRFVLVLLAAALPIAVVGSLLFGTLFT